MIRLNNEDIAKIIYEAILDCSGDYQIKNRILESLEHDEELQEQISKVYNEIAEEYFIQGYLMAKK